MKGITVIDDYLPSKYEIVKMAVEIGGCAIIIYVAPPVLLTLINYLPWIYSGWKIYSKFTSTYGVISWAFGKKKPAKESEV
jgi:hypothetical protein